MINVKQWAKPVLQLVGEDVPSLEQRRQIGTELRNGAILLQRKKTDKPYKDIVLCVYEHNFVTWAYDNERGGCTGGDYYGLDLAGAVQGFADRK